MKEALDFLKKSILKISAFKFYLLIGHAVQAYGILVSHPGIKPMSLHWESNQSSLDHQRSPCRLLSSFITQITFFKVSFLLIYFNWRIITLQYCDRFSHTPA